jgi:hypothetical protein
MAVLISLFMVNIILRVYYLPWIRYEPDPLTEPLALNADNFYFRPGDPLSFECSASWVTDSSEQLVVCVRPYFCSAQLRCLHNYLSPLSRERAWNEYRVSTIVYEPLVNGSTLMANLAEQQTIVRIRYYDGETELDALGEVTGVMEDPDFLFIHPPRSAYFGILEICPMPSLNFPLKFDTTYTSNLTMPGTMVPDEYRARYPNGTSIANAAIISDSVVIPEFPYVKDAVLVRATGVSPDGFLNTRTDMVFSRLWGPLIIRFTTPACRIQLTRTGLDTGFAP